MDKNTPEKDITKDKWEFDDYAFTITGILVGFLLVVPEILYSQTGISILGGSMSGEAQALLEELDDGSGLNVWNINRLRTLSPFLFLLTTTICFFKDAFDARKSGGYTGSVFTHTFESLVEDAIYMAVTTIMVYGAILFGAMYASWLAGPIAWILFVFIFPLVKRKSGNIDETEETDKSWLLLSIFASGVIVEVIMGTWIAFPLSWLIICAIELARIIHKGHYTTDIVFNMIYLAFTVLLLALGLIMGFWLVSWAAFPIALLICWILSKFSRFRRPGRADCE